MVKNRIVIGTEVLLRIKDCAESLGMSEDECEKLFSRFIRHDPDFGPVITEADYSSELARTPELIEKNGGSVEMTRIETLSAEVAGIKSIKPLKRIFLSSVIPAEKLDAALDADERKSVNETIERFLSKRDHSLNHFSEQFKKIKDTGKDAFLSRGALAKAELELQFVTEINNGIAGIMCIAVGKGIFHHIWVDECNDELWSEVKRGPKGELVIPEYSWERNEIVDIIKARVGSRDFRKYGVFDNIKWVVSHIPPKSESHDYLDYREDAIDISLSTSFIAKLLCPDAFPTEMYLEGIPKVMLEMVEPVGNEN